MHQPADAGRSPYKLDAPASASCRLSPFRPISGHLPREIPRFLRSNVFSAGRWADIGGFRAGVNGRTR